MQTARKLDVPRTWTSPAQNSPQKPPADEGPENQPTEIKVGKMIFYVTVALGIWFFYWFNGIQCPC
ncbi:MAG TPA: hypothetical protein VH681_14055 [Nitrospiraceae bacterium]|jgi:hypothetical protein